MRCWIIHHLKVTRVSLFFCFLFENQLFNLIQVNVIFSLIITDSKLKLQKKLIQKTKSKDTLDPNVSIRNSGLKWKSQQSIKGSFKNVKILDPLLHIPLLVTFFVIRPLPHVTRQIVTNVFLDQRP